MITKKIERYFRGKLLLLIPLLLINLNLSSQGVQFGLYAEPLVSWFASDTELTVNEGARPGFSYGLAIDAYFAGNYAFSTGINITNASGRLNYNDTLQIKFKNSETELYPGQNIVYKIRYLCVPLGIKLKTNQIGYMTFFANTGMKPKIVIGAKGNIPALDIENESLDEELRLFNLGYHIGAGMEYSLGGKTAIVIGLDYEDNFLDITKDREGQPADKIRHQIIRFRVGLNF